MTRRERSEWIGGRFVPPFMVEESGGPFQPELVLWLEQPSGLIVGHAMIDPEDGEGALARALLAAFEQPLAGPPRRPGAIRVADAALAAEVRSAVRAEIPVAIAPTPELDAVVDDMVGALSAPDEDASYLEAGIPPETMAKFFSAARELFTARPWKLLDDDEVLRMDVPALGVEGACLSIIGALGESFGVLIFPSRDGYEAFARAADAPLAKRGRMDLGSSWLSIGFERGADLPASLRREVARHRWSVAGANAYPVAEAWERNGAPRPLDARELALATACAAALAKLFTRHARRFRAKSREPICDAVLVDDDLEVRLAAPYEAVAERDLRHDLDGELVGELERFARRRFGEAWLRFAEDFADPWEARQLAVPWSVYGFEVEGATVLEHHLAGRGRKLPPAKRAWLEAQREAWLSVWEVTEVAPGESLVLCDLLSGQTRCVREASGSRGLVVRDVVLARVVDHEGASLLCGAHPRALPPITAAELVRRARGRLRRKGDVAVEALRNEAFGRYLIRRWDEAAAELDAQSAMPPELRNTDGEVLLPTTDHFDVAPGARARVEARLAALPGVEPPEPGEDPPVYHFLRPGNAMHASWDNTLVGMARLSGGKLRLEANSRERADALRAQVDAACGNDLRHRTRTHADPLSQAAVSRALPAAGPPPPEAQVLLHEFKQQHYAGWLDEPIPALGGRTPRAAAHSREGRRLVDVLLKELENREQRTAGAAAFDFSALRRELDLV